MRHFSRSLGWVEKKSLQIAYVKGFYLCLKVKLLNVHDQIQGVGKIFGHHFSTPTNLDTN